MSDRTIPLKDRIYQYISRYGTVSLAELKDAFGEEFTGDLQWGQLEYNIIFWTGMNVNFIDALTSLCREKNIQMLFLSSSFIYLLDGEFLNLPIARRHQTYKSPRWLPIVFRTREEREYYVQSCRCRLCEEKIEPFGSLWNCCAHLIEKHNINLFKVRKSDIPELWRWIMTDFMEDIGKPSSAYVVAEGEGENR